MRNPFIALLLLCLPAFGQEQILNQGWTAVAFPYATLKSFEVGPGVTRAVYYQNGEYHQIPFSREAVQAAGTTHAFWVYSTQASSVKAQGTGRAGTLALEKGWNLVSSADDRERKVGQPAFEILADGTTAPAEALKAGRPYWLYATVEAALTPPDLGFPGLCVPGAATVTTVADFNGDGLPDLALGNASTTASEPSTVTVKLARGGGVFSSGETYAVGVGALALATADLDQDGRPDLVATCANSSTTTLLIATGPAGHFVSARSLAGGRFPVGLAVADLNGDKFPDLALANGQGTQVTLLLSEGPARYGPPLDLPGAGPANALAIADVTADGRQDLVLATRSGHVALLTGLPEPASFSPPVLYEAGVNPTSLAVADFNTDGYLDLAVSNNGPDGPGFLRYSFSVLMGAGPAGGFRPAVRYGAHDSGGQIAVADFNRDGRSDVVYCSERLLTVWLTTAEGRLDESHDVSLGGFYRCVEPADMDGDGVLDLVVGRSAQPGQEFAEVALVAGQAGGRFEASTTLEADISFSSDFWGRDLVTADFNEDGFPDLATQEAEAGSKVQFHLSPGPGGRFTPPSHYQSVYWSRVLAAGDFNGDHHPDLAGADQGPNLSVVLGTGQGRFKPSLPGLRLPDSCLAIVAADLNRDGRDDLAVSGVRSLNVLLSSDREGGFEPPLSYGVTEGCQVAAGDLNGDGLLDLVVGEVRPTSYVVQVFLATGSPAGFRPAAEFAYPKDVSEGLTGVTGLVVADLNGDGALDVAVALQNQRSEIQLLLNTRREDLLARGQALPTVRPTSLVTADFDGDGRPDLAASNRANSVGIFLARGPAGAFAEPRYYATGSEPGRLAVADFDQDGRLDLAVVDRNPFFLALRVLFNKLQ